MFTYAYYESLVSGILLSHTNLSHVRTPRRWFGSKSASAGKRGLRMCVQKVGARLHAI
jgi:hypothetical protein